MIKKNPSGIYTTDVFPADYHWTTARGQKYLRLAYPVEKAFMLGAVSIDEYKALHEEINNLLEKEQPEESWYEDGPAVSDAVMGEI